MLVGGSLGGFDNEVGQLDGGRERCMVEDSMVVISGVQPWVAWRGDGDRVVAHGVQGVGGGRTKKEKRVVRVLAVCRRRRGLGGLG